MERKTTVSIALVLFALLSLLAILFILREDKKNDFEMNRGAAPAPNDSSIRPEDGAKKEEQEPEKEYFEDDLPQGMEEKEPTDYSPLIEKYRGKEIVKVKTSEKAVTLTFDAGANADGVDAVLAILRENDIRGTFFLTGKFIERYPEKVKAMMQSGGDIGNHTYDHPYLSQLSRDRIDKEIDDTEAALAKIDGTFQPLLRHPYGDRNQSVLNAVSEAGYINVRWTIDSLGWKGTSGGMTKDTVRDKVLKNASPGAIIMMHLGSNPDDKTHLDSKALPEIIEKLRNDGYEFVTLSELLAMEK